MACTNIAVFSSANCCRTLDALRYRKALYQLDDMAIPNLSVRFEHVQESGIDVVRCTDNGSGMDEEIVSHFLTRAGRSFYRSPAFERERTRFREHRCDFDPCARFGIGFMSCFMFGDEIRIRTRRDYGAARERGRPLEIEIAGLSGLVVVRPGSEDQPVGTTVEIRGRRRSFPIDWWTDPVHLIDVLDGYALAAEFPITGDCRVAGLSRRAVIEPRFAVLPDPLEGSAISRKTTYSGSFGTADQRLQGEVRVSTLLDSDGIPAVANEQASIKVAGMPAHRVIAVSDGSSIEFGPSKLDDSQQLCCDGILVAGPPGRRDASRRLRGRLGHRSLNYGFGGAAFLLDARGDLKPILTPARTPPDNLHHRNEPSWRRLFDAAAPAYSNVLRDIVRDCARAGSPDRFWLVAEGYSLALSRLPLSAVFAHLDFPFAITGSNDTQWRSLRTVGRLQLHLPDDDKADVELTAADGAVLVAPPAIRELAAGQGTVSVWSLAHIIAGCSVVCTDASNAIELTPDEARADATLSDLTTGGAFETRYLLRFANMKDVVSVCGRGGFANLDHPITQYYRTTAEDKRWEERSPLERLAAKLVWSVVGNRFDLPPAGSDARIRRELATLYRAIDWDVVEPSLRPPFRVFRQGHGIDDLTDAHLNSWTTLTPPVDDD